MNGNFHWATSDAVEEFWTAIRSGNVDVVRKIISQFPKIGRWQRGDGAMPLDIFAGSHNASDELLDLLMTLEWDAFGLEANPVYAACYAGNMRSLRAIVAKGFDSNGSARAYATPLHIAAEKGRTKAVEFLLQHEADPSREDVTGRIPMEIAESKGHTEVAELLRTHASEYRTRFIAPDKTRDDVTLNLLDDESEIRRMIHEAVAGCIAAAPDQITAVALHGSGYQGFVECGFESGFFDPDQPDCGADVSLRQMSRCDFPQWSAAYSANNRVSVEFGAKNPIVKTAWGAGCEALDTPFFRFFKTVLKALIKEKAFDELPLAGDCLFGVQTFFHHHCLFWKRNAKK